MLSFSKILHIGKGLLFSFWSKVILKTKGTKQEKMSKSKDSDKPTFCIYLEMEPYLRDWLIYDSNGESPIRFKRLSIENRILETFLIALPPNAKPDMPTPNSVAIAIPCFKHSDPSTYNYLPVNSKLELKKCIRNRFLIELWNDLHQFGYIGKRKDLLVTAWMESHGIEFNDTNFNTILKIYQRQHRAYLERERYKKKKAKKSRKKFPN